MFFTGRLRNIHLEERLVKEITEKIHSDFVSVQSLKLNIELLNSICNAVEDACRFKGLKAKGRKPDVVLKIYENTFGLLTDEERNQVKELIEYLWVEGKIKPRSILKFLFDIATRFLSERK